MQIALRINHYKHFKITPRFSIEIIIFVVDFFRPQTDFLTPHCTVVLQQQCDNATLIRLIYTYIHTYIHFTGHDIR